ncbi:MAG: retropepsin-like aspartic protease [Candidatus Aminicenantes bacterium]
MAAGIGAVALLAAGFFLAGWLSKRGESPAPATAAADPNPTASRASDRGVPITSGEIVVLDARGAEVSRTQAPVAGGGWAALPLSALFGGTSLEFHSHGASGGGPVPIERGIWAAGEPLVLLRIEAGPGVGSGAIELRPWRQALPLDWHAVSADGGAYRIEAEAVPDARRAISATIVLPREVRQPGFFVQDDQLVGWTFGEVLETGYLWTAQRGTELEPNIGAGELLSTIAGSSREAAFARALTAGGAIPALEKLRALAAGFDQVPLLQARDLPPGLRQEAVIREMHAVSSDLIRRGGGRDVAAVLNSYVLAEAGDPELVKDAVLAVLAVEDYNRALRHLERLKAGLSALPRATRALAGLDAFHAKLYKDWIRQIVEKGGYYSGESAYEEARQAFPDDAEIHLLGVEVALAANDHELAEERLRAREYRAKDKEWADRLAARLQAHEESQTVVIRFGPREQQIKLDAKINGVRTQEFIVDTGANTSSIPSSALKALGIRIDDSTRVVRVSTAGGVGLTYQVSLDSIGIEGLVVRNLEVLVLDLPHEDGVGLLGLDFLRNFRYEIDNQQGTLTLRKK